MLKKISAPPILALVIFFATIVAMTCCWMINLLWPGSINKLFPWSLAISFSLSFAIFNSLLSLRADSFMKYWQASMYSYMLLALCNGMAAWGFSGVPIRQAGSFQGIFLVVSIGYLVLLSMVNFMKTIVNFAQKEEWNQPRKK